MRGIGGGGMWIGVVGVGVTGFAFFATHLQNSMLFIVQFFPCSGNKPCSIGWSDEALFFDFFIL